MFGGGFDYGNMFNQPQFMFGQRNPQYGQQPNTHANTGPPPVSKRLLNSLPIVTVTTDDLLEETNKECAICLSEIKLGMKACKLPCGHLYDRECLKVWLEKHCTCPVCRFELETDDVQYESQRKCRMKSRKLRYRLDELQHKRASELKEIASSLSVNISGCIDKNEIIDLLVKSNKIEITEGAPNIEIGRSAFQKKGVGELRQLLLSFGISDEEAIEKDELRVRLLNSGRIVLIDDDMNTVEKKSDNITNNVKSNEKVTLDENITIEQLFILDVRELKLLSSTLNVKITNCLDKRDIIDNILASGKIRSPSKSHELNNSNSYQSPSTYPTSSTSGMKDCHMNYDDRMTINLSELNMMNVRELKFLAEQCNVNPSGCVERSEIVSRIRDSGKIVVLTDVDKTY